LRPIFKVLDLPQIIGLAGHYVVKLEASRALDQYNHSPVLVALHKLDDPRGASYPARAGLVGEYHPELRFGVQALIYHLLVALLEDVQR
jgi:hypothetical protein